MDGYGTTSNWWPRPHYQHFSTRSPQKSSSASNEALTESGKKLNEPTNWIQKFSIFLIIVVILASIAVAIAVPLLIGNGPKPDDVDVFFNIRIEQDYARYNDSKSTEYKAFVNYLCQLLIPVLNGPGQIGANYVTDSCQVVNLKNGSIIARVTSSFHIVDTRQTSINDIENNIFSTFVQRVDNGSFGLPVDKTAFTISGRSRSRAGKDPCDPSLTTCDQICTSVGTNIKCSCFKGYQLNVNGYTCEGVDICGVGLDKCDRKTTYCQNGGYQTFTCPCLAGYKRDPSLVTTSSPLGQLPPTPTSCVDINECVDTPWVCNSNTSTCNNTIGGYMCNCLAGYMPSPEPFMANVCIDIDECAYPYKDNHCDYTTTTCVNTPGNYTCACRPGFDTYANYYCSNTNECTTSTPCNLNTSVCQDTFGAFRCNCIQPNFTRSIDGSCIDVDECALQRDTCNVYNQTCLNNFGGFTCPCKVGFNLTSSGDCVDIDECMATTSPCPNMNCSNTVGSYYCYCPAGFNVVTVNSTNACQDIDECAIRPSVCYLSDSYCNNTVGNYSCPCKFAVSLGTPTNPADGCTIGESGFFIKSTMAATAATVSYNIAVSNYGLLSGNPPFAIIQTSSSLSGFYWVHQTLSSATPTTITPTWGTNTFVVALSRSASDMTSAGALLSSSTTNPISTVITQGTPTSDGSSDTSLVAFSTAAITGIANTMSVTDTFPQNFSITVPTPSSGSGPVPIFVSLTTAAVVGNPHVVQLVLNSQVILQNRFDRNDASSETITSATIIHVPAGTVTFSVQLVSGSTSCSAANSPCSFSYFSYSPNDARFTTVYWSAYRSTPLLAPASTAATVGFDIVSIEGQTGLWDALNKAIVAPVSGAYYININAATQPTKDLNVRICVNGADVSIGLYSTQSSGVISKSRAAIVMLNKGDKVTIVAASGSALYGDTNWPSSSFTGFLLYARQ